MKHRLITALICSSLLIGIAGCDTQTEFTTTASETETETTVTETPVDETAEVIPEPESEPYVEPAREDGYPSQQYIYHTYFEEYDYFEVTSPDVVNGVWSDVISNTDEGENESPELSWKAVEGASEYVIFMVDANSNGFLHWKSSGITKTNLPRGWAPKLSEYNGPHVGHGYTHQYDIYVVAIKAPVKRVMGGINAVNPKLDEFMRQVDVDADGNTGNIIAVGKISGYYTDIRFRDGETPVGPYTM